MEQSPNTVAGVRLAEMRPDMGIQAALELGPETPDADQTVIHVENVPGYVLAPPSFQRR